MPNGKSDIMAQAVYLAQLEAARGNCKCNTCRILRKATKSMTEQFLAPAGADPPGIKEAVEAAQEVSGEVVNLGEEDE
ncbi:hypothetical protein ES708_02606 [subsurface metagenome]